MLRLKKPGNKSFQAELHELLSIRNFQTLAAKVPKASLSAYAALEIGVETVIHEPPFMSCFNQIGIVHDLQAM